MKWEIVIGLETHTQLATRSKIFSGASTAFGAAPNTQASALELALPGTLPVLNKSAVECAIRFGLAVGATIAEHSIFARKNYFYPDLPKGYQISQYEIPVVQGGSLSFVVAGSNGDAAMKTVQLTRAHLEEDAGKSLHGEALTAGPGFGIPGLMIPGRALADEFRDYTKLSAIDLNRAGTPLLEIVSEPEMRSSAEAVAYAKALHTLVVWLDICDGNMQEGSFRCDANVSVRQQGADKFGTRVEIKNLNSFRFLQQAIDFEVRRQIELIEDGGKVVQETRLYDSDRNETRSMRSKEDAMDYRYFPDPDLLPLAVSRDWVERVRAQLPELPAAKRERFVRDYGLPEYDAQTLTASKALADYFETVAQNVADKKAASNWVMGEVSARLNESNIDAAQSPVTPAQLAGLISRVLDGTINNKTAKDVFAALWSSEGDSADAIIDARGLKQISDAGAIETLIDEVLAANSKSVEEFRAGKDKAFNALVGQAMKATKGKANPQQVNEILRRKLTQ